MALCEAAAYYKSKGMSLWDKMIEMYERYGYCMDGVQSLTLKGKEGIEKIQNTLEKLRKDVPTVIKDMVTGKTTKTGLPKSNVLYYDLEDDVWVCIRPSGTEPKLKFYYGVKGTSFEDAQEKLDKLGKYLLDMVNSML